MAQYIMSTSNLKKELFVSTNNKFIASSLSVLVGWVARDTYYRACSCGYHPNFTGRFCYNLGILLASCPRANSALCINKVV